MPIGKKDDEILLYRLDANFFASGNTINVGWTQSSQTFSANIQGLIDTLRLYYTDIVTKFFFWCANNTLAKYVSGKLYNATDAEDVTGGEAESHVTNAPYQSKPQFAQSSNISYDWSAITDKNYYLYTKASNLADTITGGTATHYSYGVDFYGKVK